MALWARARTGTPPDPQYSNKIVFERKKVDDVLGGQGAWDNVDATEGKREQRAPARLQRPQQGAGEPRPS